MASQYLAQKTSTAHSFDGSPSSVHENFYRMLIDLQRRLDSASTLADLRLALKIPGASSVIGLLGSDSVLKDADWLSELIRVFESGSSASLGPLNDDEGDDQASLRRIVLGMILQRVRYLQGESLAGSVMLYGADPLTGLPGMGALEGILQKSLKRAKDLEEPFSVLFIDIDQFKSVNDRFGHCTGNSLLKEFGLILRRAFRESDALVRYGGDEFVAVLQGCKGEQALETAERIRKAIEDRRFCSLELQVTVSIGIAVCPEDAGSAAAVIEAADFAMYGAKRHGANRTYRVHALDAQAAMPQGASFSPIARVSSISS